jgi:hypothetical protein
MRAYQSSQGGLILTRSRGLLPSLPWHSRLFAGLVQLFYALPSLMRFHSISISGWIRSPNGHRSPLTGTFSAAFHWTLWPKTGGEKVRRTWGNTIVIQGPVGGVLVDLSGIRVMTDFEPKPLPLPSGLPSDFDPFAGGSYVEVPLQFQAKVHLTARVFRSPNSVAPWSTSNMLGPAVLALVTDASVRDRKRERR